MSLFLHTGHQIYARSYPRMGDSIVSSTGLERRVLDHFIYFVLQLTVYVQLYSLYSSFILFIIQSISRKLTLVLIEFHLPNYFMGIFKATMSQN